MKFHIKKVVLWLNNGKIRSIPFKPNKVNVITGDSSTGKTEILEIIDYCFFGSSSNISESIVNENVAWYGLLFQINGKEYTVARKSLTKGKLSNKYFFSSEGEIPDKVNINNTESAIKSLLETEFSIDNNVAIPYGSNLIKAGTKISLRYFLMFNTISVNIIENDTGVFFDKQTDSRYRDALPRIFDLAVGIENIENILKKEKKAELETALSKLKKKRLAISQKSSVFDDEQVSLVKEAKEYSLIPNDLNLEKSLDELKNIAFDTEASLKEESDHIEKDYYDHERKIHNLKRFVNEYNSYKKNLINISDSLKPIEFLIEKDNEIVKTSIFDEIIRSFSSDLEIIRGASKANTPVDRQLKDEIKRLENELSKLRNVLSTRPSKNKSFQSDKSKYFFLGEVKSKMDLYSATNNSNLENIEDEVLDLETQIGTLNIIDTTEKKELTIKLIEEIISEYITETNTALENYATYKPVFNYKNKALQLRKPKTSFIENVGSSSNHMFLQLFFTLAMQEIAFQNESPFIAPYLIIDQPSRPYYGTGDKQKKVIEHSDESKITKAFELLNNFIKTRIDNGGEFQMIVFEHIPEEIFKDMENVVLVEEFTEGNALIPDHMLDN